MPPSKKKRGQAARGQPASGVQQLLDARGAGSGELIYRALQVQLQAPLTHSPTHSRITSAFSVFYLPTTYSPTYSLPLPFIYLLVIDRALQEHVAREHAL